MRMPLELNITIEDRIKEHQDLGESICRAMEKSLSEIKLTKEINIGFDKAEFRLEKDPFSGEYSLHGEWSNSGNMKCGSIVFHADSTFFAEYDVVENHPEDERWFIEAVTAWGRDSNIKVEARLIERV